MDAVATAAAEAVSGFQFDLTGRVRISVSLHRPPAPHQINGN